MAKKDYLLEHTRPLFNEQNILSLHHLYIQHTFMDLIKIMKYRIPISLFQMFCPSPRTMNFLMLLPKINLEVSRLNFVFSASSIWNSLIGKLLNRCLPNSNGILVPGSSKCSDLTAPISYIKEKLKHILLRAQKLDVEYQFDQSNSKEWNPSNFLRY